MKLNASTFTIGDDYKYLKLKSLKPLYMPNVRIQLLLRKAIGIYENNKNNSSNFGNLNSSLIIHNYKRKNLNHNNSLISKNNLTKTILLNPKLYNNNKSKINRVTSATNINKLYLKKNNTKNNKEKIRIPHFSLVTLNKALNNPRSSSVIIDSNKKTKNTLNIKKIRIKGQNVLKNTKKNNNNYSLDNSFNERRDTNETNKLKCLNKDVKNEIKYYKWFI